MKRFLVKIGASIVVMLLGPYVAVRITQGAFREIWGKEGK